MSVRDTATPVVKRHRHEFTALYEHFGPHGKGRQDAHRHVCFIEGCEAVLIGRGRTCNGKRSSHRREKP